MLSHFTAVAALLSVISYVQASPTRRDSDNGFCPQLLKSCAASSIALTNPWSVEACIFGATCFGGRRPVDNFLAAVSSAKNATSAPASLNVPRISQAIFNKISTDGKVITQQNFIDGVYGTLAATNGPFPDASFVVGDYERVTTWTAFCNGQGVPFMNFADYYQFSATVNSNGCQTVRSTTAAVSSTPTLISGEASCQKQFTTCVAAVNAAVSDAWSHPSCLFAATCFGGKRPVDGLLSVLFETKTGKSSSSGAPTSLQETRLSTATMKTISTDGSTITQQNWIDAYYDQLSAVGGPFPTDASIVIADFNRVAVWTGFCTGGIPFMNVADYFEFSSSVSSNASC